MTKLEYRELLDSISDISPVSTNREFSPNTDLVDFADFSEFSTTNSTTEECPEQNAEADSLVESIENYWRFVEFEQKWKIAMHSGITFQGILFTFFGFILATGRPSPVFSVVRDLFVFDSMVVTFFLFLMGLASLAEGLMHLYLKFSGEIKKLRLTLNRMRIVDGVAGLGLAMLFYRISLDHAPDRKCRFAGGFWSASLLVLCIFTQLSKISEGLS